VSRPCVFAVFNLNEVYLPHIDIELVSSAYISALSQEEKKGFVRLLQEKQLHILSTYVVKVKKLMCLQCKFYQSYSTSKLSKFFIEFPSQIGLGLKFQGRIRQSRAA